VTGGLSLFARTFVIGIAVAAPVGAMGVLCIQRTLAGGVRSGLATGAGIATADATYAACAAFGLAAVSAALVSWQVPLRVAGGSFLVYLGLRSLLGASGEAAKITAAENDAPPPATSQYLSAVGLTLTNPMTIMAFGAVFVGAGLAAAPSTIAAAVATVGVALGSFSWWIALVAAVSLLRRGLSGSAVLWVARISGAAIALFGVFAVVSAF